jgi:hypothetical protein
MARMTRGKRVYVEASGLRIGSQVQSAWLPLMGITYDPRSDLLSVSTGSLNHMIHHPSQIQVDYEADGLHNVEVVDSEGNHQLIRLREPLMLEGDGA